jgi:hypothetical protein
MGYNGTNANLMSVPPFVDGLIGLLVIVYMSDRIKEQSPWLCIGEIVGLIGLIVIILSKTHESDTDSRMYVSPAPLVEEHSWLSGWRGICRIGFVYKGLKPRQELRC